MRKKFTILVAVLLTASVFAQSPEKMSYQAVIRNSSDQLVKNQIVGMQISILQGSASGTVVYAETQTPTTNANGLVSIEIGGGAGFVAIDWSAGPYFIKTETDPTGSTSYTITGTSQLLSVPYALHAKTAETLTGGITESDPTVPAHVKAITTDNISNWNTAHGWGDHSAEGYATKDMNSEKIRNLADPTDAQDAATKAYVDALLARIEALEEKDLLSNGFTDTRDGNHYNAVKIGNQIWMAENLKYLPSVFDPGTGSQTTPYYYVYEYNGTNVNDAKATANYTTYGVLYNWPAAMNGAASSTANPSGVQGVCPAGWHLPSVTEWAQMENYLADNGYNYDGTIGGGRAKIGKSLASTSGWMSSSNTGAVGNTDYPTYRNKSGFTALPGGSRYFSGTFGFIGGVGNWWSATELSTSNAFYRGLSSGFSSIGSGNDNKGMGFSIRCVRD